MMDNCEEMASIEEMASFLQLDVSTSQLELQVVFLLEFQLLLLLEFPVLLAFTPEE